MDNLDLQGFIMADPNTNLVTILGQFNQADLANHLSNWLYTEGDFTSFLTNICTNHHEFILYSLQNGALYDFFLYIHTHYTADFENMYMALSSNSFVDFNTSYDWFISSANMSDVSLWMQTNLDCNITANMLLNLPDIQNILNSWFNSLSDIANPIYNGFAEPNALWNYLVQYDNTNLRSIIYSQFDNDIMLTWFETNERSNFITQASTVAPGHVGTWQTSNAGHSKETYFNMVRTYYGQSAYDLLIQRYLNNTRTYLDSFGIAEWHIYGSSRLGIYQSNLNLVTQRFDADINNGSFEDPENISTTSYEPSYNFYTLQRGNKRYELSNHLGNVLAVVSDRKLPVCNEYNKFEDFEGTPNVTGAWNIRDSWSGQNAVISLEDGKLNIKDNITADPHARYNYQLGKDIPPNQSIRLSFDLEHVDGDHDWQVGIVYSTTENAYQGNMIYFTATSGHNEINFVTPGYFWRVRLLHIPTAQDMEFNLDNFHIENLTQDSASKCHAAVISATDYSPFGAPLPGRTYQASEYRFSFNGQERDDEIAGVGNIMTAEFWEYDTRLGRRWNVDPRHFAWESSYSVMGDNPIVRNDKKGDKWKDGNDKKMASELDRKLEKRSKGLSKEANKYDKKADSYKDNDIEKYNEYKSLANIAREGVIEMNNARNELVKMGCEDVEQEFHFEAIDPESDNIANTYMDKSGVINMQYFAWDDASAIHEGNHGYQYFTGRMKFTTEGTEFGDIHDEVRAYKRQFLFDPGSVSTIKLDNGETIKTYQRITPEIIHRIVTEDKEGNKILPYLNDSDYDLPMLKDPSL